jgi:hypothetical protein
MIGPDWHPLVCAKGYMGSEWGFGTAFATLEADASWVRLHMRLPPLPDTWIRRSTVRYVCRQRLFDSPPRRPGIRFMTWDGDARIVFRPRSMSDRLVLDALGKLGCPTA